MDEEEEFECKGCSTVYNTEECWKNIRDGTCRAEYGLVDDWTGWEILN